LKVKSTLLKGRVTEIQVNLYKPIQYLTMRKLFPLLVACLFLTAAQSLKAQQCPVFEPIKPTPLIQVGNTTHVKILPGYTNHYSQLD